MQTGPSSFFIVCSESNGGERKKKDLGQVESLQHRWRQASLHLIGREGESINWSSCLCLHETRLSKAIKRDHSALKSLSGSLSCACVCVFQSAAGQLSSCSPATRRAPVRLCSASGVQLFRCIQLLHNLDSSWCVKLGQEMRICH